MRCIEISHHDNGGLLSPATRPQPEPGPDEVLINVAAAGVNRPDVVQRRGLYPPPAGASDLPGLEVSGEIVAIGEQVDAWRPGDKVCALLSGGGYAEYATAHQDLCLPIPNGLSPEEAAGLPETYFTVWDNVFLRGNLQAGETLLVHGGGSGIGTTAIQLAKAYGASVYATAGSDEKCQRCLELGADHAINYRQEDFLEVVKTLTDKRGVNVILDMVGGDYIDKNIKAAAFGGRIVSIAFLRGSKTSVDFMPMMLKQLVLTGSTMRARPVAQKAVLAKQLLSRIWPLFAEKKLRVITAAEFPLEQAMEAHQLMESNTTFGKIILKVSP